MTSFSMIESLSQKIIFDTKNIETNKIWIKNQQTNQMQIRSILIRLQMNEVLNIINNCQLKTLFIVLAILAEEIQKIKDKNIIWKYFQCLNSQFKSWSTDTYFQRKKQNKKLQYHHQGLMGKIIGTLLKLASVENTMQNWNRIIKQIFSIQKNYYQLFVINHYFGMIQSMEIDQFSILGNFLKNFQTEIISQIVNLLSSNFQKTKQRLDIQQLENLQGKLCLVQQKEEVLQTSKFPLNQVKYFVTLFEVLKQIVSFDYQVISSQAEFNLEYNQCRIFSFPNSIIFSIIKQDFIKGLYSIVQKLLNSTHFSIDLSQQRTIRNVFVDTSFNLLTKITKTRIKNNQYQLRKRFIIEIINGQNRLIKIKSSLYVMQRIMEVNCELIKNIEIGQILEYNQGQVWINYVLLYCKSIVQQMKITFQNKLALKAISLIKLIIFQVILYELDNSIKQFNIFNYVFSFQKLYFQNFMETQCLPFQQQFISINQLEEKKQSFFKDIKVICCVSLKQFNTIIQYYLKRANSKNKASKFFLFMSQIVTNNFLNTQKMYFKIQSKDAHHFGKNILDSLKLIQLCLQQLSGLHQKDDDSSLLKQSMFFLIEKLLSQNLQFVSVSQCSMRILSKIYDCISGNIITDFSLKFKNEGYFYQLFKYGLKLAKFCQQKNGVAMLQKLKPLLLTYKNHVLKHYSKTSQYFQALKTQFQQLRQQKQKKNSISFQKIIYQLIPILLFTGSRMETRMILQKEANKIINLLFQQQSPLNILSICNFSALISSIQKQDAIYYLISKIGLRNIQVMIQKCSKLNSEHTFLIFQLSHKILKVPTKKSKNILIKLEILSILIPVWNKFILESLSNIQKMQIQQIVLQTFSNLASNEAINFYYLHKHPKFKLNFRNYLKNVSCYINNLIVCLHECNKNIQHNLLVDFKIIVKILADFFLLTDSQTKGMLQRMIMSFLQVFMKILRDTIYLKIKYEQSLVYKLCQIFYQILDYFDISRKKLHKQQLKQVAQNYFVKQKQRNLQILKLLVLFSKVKKVNWPIITQQVQKIQSKMESVYGTLYQLKNYLSLKSEINFQQQINQILNQNQIIPEKEQIISEKEENSSETNQKIHMISQSLECLKINDQTFMDQY